jgi:hypothetical protein
MEPMLIIREATGMEILMAGTEEIRGLVISRQREEALAKEAVIVRILPMGQRAHKM